MNNNRETKISKYISYLLRHHPEEGNITLDEEGYADTSALIAAVRKEFDEFDMPYLEKIVAEDEKTRYSFTDDKSKIRANHGHSVKGISPGLKEVAPPDVMYHGTAERFMDSIREQGILKMSRLYVHLSADEETAEEVGRRHGKPVIISIDTKKMHEDGLKFYNSANGLWLTDTVPVKYFISERKV